jgi:glycosyltransferase involved in cell wall biosynthesis
MNEPLVSIILCSYNGEEYLEEQLHSLDTQTYKNIEVICSDNNSTDKSAEILSNWCNKQTNRKLIHCSEKGLNKNFFDAIKHAKGDFVIFCDQDDIWMPDKVEKLLRFHQENEQASMVYCLSDQFTGNTPGISSKINIIPLEGDDIRKTLLISFTLGHNILIRKSILDKIPVPPNESVAYDWWITVSAMCMGFVKCLPEVLTHWRQHTNNTTKKINDDYFYSGRIQYLQAFSKNKLVSKDYQQWINEAINNFASLREAPFSFRLFRFILSNARLIFFYKKKKNGLQKWISYTKWAFRMSKRNYRP